MNPKLKTLLFFLVGAFAGIGVMMLINPPKEVKEDVKIEYSKEQQKINDAETQELEKSEKKAEINRLSTINNAQQSIDRLTKESVVISFLKKHQKLPNYFITKKEAMEYGWVPSEANLCEVMPGKAIGGDKFSNREKQLPLQKGRIYYEADVNYECGHRNADRIVYSNDGLIFLTHDHYKTFQQQ